MGQTDRTDKIGLVWRLSVGVLFLGLLLWVWPNLIHEPLHLLALKMQGASGTINFNWGFPAHPSITRIGVVSGLFGGLFYLLLPSFVSVLILFLCWLTRHRAGFLTHVVLPLYLTFDLLINILHFRSVTSDFHFLTALPFFVWFSLLVFVLSVGYFVVFAGLRVSLFEVYGVRGG